MSRSAPTRAAYGATLIELMVALTVGAILLAIAIPSFRHLMGSTNLSGMSNDLAADITFARTEAAMRRVDVAVTSSAGGWAAGWTVNVPSKSSAAPPPPLEVLRRHSAIAATYTVASEPASASTVTYQPDGTLTSDTANICFKFNAPSDTRNNANYLRVLPSGSVQQASGTAAPTDWTCP